MNSSLLPLVGYIDPGSGMLLLQLVLAGCLSVFACFRKSILRVLGVFRGNTASFKSDPISTPQAHHTAEPLPSNIVPLPERTTESEASTARAA
jgi:hypothetical protein